jgi:hypothetical protein
MKNEELKVKLPKHLAEEMKAIGRLAGLSAETVIRVALATEARRWERKREAQESSSAT